MQVETLMHKHFVTIWENGATLWQYDPGLFRRLCFGTLYPADAQHMR